MRRWHEYKQPILISTLLRCLDDGPNYLLSTLCSSCSEWFDETCKEINEIDSCSVDFMVLQKLHESPHRHCVGPS